MGRHHGTGEVGRCVVAQRQPAGLAAHVGGQGVGGVGSDDGKTWDRERQVLDGLARQLTGIAVADDQRQVVARRRGDDLLPRLLGTDVDVHGGRQLTQRARPIVPLLGEDDRIPSSAGGQP